MSLCPCFLESAGGAYQRALDDVRDRLGREDVGLDRIVAVLPLLLALTAPDISCCLLLSLGPILRQFAVHLILDPKQDHPAKLAYILIHEYLAKA